MESPAVERFLNLLKRPPPGPVFNPWWQRDQENDIGSDAARIRRDQLRAYLCARMETAGVAIIGEALGYRGGHFTGIAMTSERILLGHSKSIVVSVDSILGNVRPRRTSKPEKCPSGFSEPTATIVWSALINAGLRPKEFVIWNAFPWHSFDRDEGMLSNRTPAKSEQLAGLSVLEAFFALFAIKKTIGLGKIAAIRLGEIGIKAECVRHPASGGARLFRQQITAALKSF